MTQDIVGAFRVLYKVMVHVGEQYLIEKNL